MSRPIGRVIPPIERFWRHVEPEPMSGCWLWAGCINNMGYGQFSSDAIGTLTSPHRFAYEHYVGPIPAGKVLDHLCRTPRCANPQHLEPVTQRENILRGAHPTAVAVRTNRCHRGHDLNDAYIFPSSGKRRCRLCRRVSI